MYNPKKQSKNQDTSPYYYVNNGYQIANHQQKGFQTQNASPQNRIPSSLSQTMNKGNRNQEQSPLNQTNSFRAHQQKKNYLFGTKYKPTTKGNSRLSQNQKRRKLVDNSNNTSGNISGIMNQTLRNTKYRNFQIDQDDIPNKNDQSQRQISLGSHNNIPSVSNNYGNLIRKKTHGTGHYPATKQFQQEYNPNNNIVNTESLPNSKNNLDLSNSNLYQNQMIEQYNEKFKLATLQNDNQIQTPKQNKEFMQFKQHTIGQSLTTKNSSSKNNFTEVNEKAQQCYFVQGQINSTKNRDNNLRNFDARAHINSYRNTSESHNHQTPQISNRHVNGNTTIHVTNGQQNGNSLQPITPQQNQSGKGINIQGNKIGYNNLNIKTNQTPTQLVNINQHPIHPNTTREAANQSKEKKRRTLLYEKIDDGNNNTIKESIQKFDKIVKNRNLRGHTTHENPPSQEKRQREAEQRQLQQQQQQQLMRQQQQAKLLQQQQQQQQQQQNKDDKNQNPINYELNNFFYNGQQRAKDNRYTSQNSNDQTTRAVSTQNTYTKNESTEGSHKVSDEQSVMSEQNYNNYQLGKVLGLGSYAIVRQAIHKISGMEVAIKTYDKKKFVDPMKLKNVQREIKILSRLKHPNIIKLYQIIETDTHVHLVMELSATTPLNDYLKRRKSKKVSEQDAKLIIRQLVDALKYCHKKCVVHRDIKLENVLISEEKVVKLIDFGFAVVVPPEHYLNVFCGTPSYMAPEIVNKKEYTAPVDVWAVAILTFRLLSGTFPFKGNTDKELYRRINSCRPDYPSNFSDELIRFIQRILVFEQKQRVTLEDLLKDDWLQIERY